MSEETEATPPPAPKTAARSPRVFLNYRREDTADAAGRLHDALADHFGHDRVFMDIDDIEPGVDFADVIANAIDSCDVVIAMIGERWLTVTDQRGRRRLDNPDDHLRMELEAAFERNVRVIPVLVHGVEMPRADELPDALKILARRNALELSASRWRYDVGRLTATLEVFAEQAAEERSRREADEHARREAEQQIAPGEPGVVANKAMATEPDDSRDTTGDLGAAAIAGAGSRVHAERPTRVAARETEPAVRSATPTPPFAAGRSSRRVPRRLILALAAAALAVAVTALVIVGSPTSSPPATNSGPHAQSGSPTSPGRLAWQQPRELDFPMPIEGPGVAEYKGKLWVAGGCSAQAGQGCGAAHWVNNVWYYDPRANVPTTCEPSGQKPSGVWCPGPQLLQPIGHPALVSDGTRLYVIGGSDTTGKALSTVYRLDSPSSTWQLGVPLGATGTGEPSAGFPRAEGAAAWVGNGIIYAGGIDEHGQVQPDIWTFDRTRWTRSGTLQPARRQLAAATTGGTVWFIGGTTDAADSKSETPVAAVDVIPAVTQIPRAAFGRVDRAAAVAFGKRICVIGGIRSAGSDPVRAVDCQPSLSITGLGSPRAGAGAAVVNGKIYVIGGWNSSNHGGQKTVEVLDIHSVQ